MFLINFIHNFRNEGNLFKDGVASNRCNGSFEREAGQRHVT